MYTRCPKCKTVFEASTSDLEAHEGLVRCGECDEIFHILDNEVDPSQIDNPSSSGGAFTESINQMLDESDEAAKESDFEESVQQEEADHSFSPGAEQKQTLEQEPEIEAEEQMETDDAPLEVEYRGISEIEPDPSIYRRKLQSRQDEVGSEIAELDSFDDTDTDIIDTGDIDREEDNLPPAPVTAGFTMVNGELDLPEPDQPENSADEDLPPRNKLKRQGITASTVGWSAASLIALVLLGIQWGVHSEGIRTNPSFRPFLESACKPLACSGVLARDAGLVKIMDSKRIDSTDGSFRLVANIQNTAEFPTSLPDLEVSLNNPFDMMIGRRTFSPQQYLNESGAHTDIQPGQIVEVELPFLAMNKPVSGYELHLRRAK